MFKNLFHFFTRSGFYFTTFPRKFIFYEKGSTDIKSPKTGALDEFVTSDRAALVRNLKGL